MAKKSPAKTETADFESALKELEALVERMEQGELSLEQSLGDFERGVELYRNCREALDAAEQKVRMLVEKSGKAELTGFNEE